MQFREMRRKRQILPLHECESILNESTAGVLALDGDNNYPYAVPISYVYKNGKLFFHSALTGHKVDAVKRNPKASFCVIDRDEIHPETYTTYFKSVIAFGQLSIIDDEEGKLEILNMLGIRYNPGDDTGRAAEIHKSLAHVLCLRMDIEYLSGKESIELKKIHK